MPAGDAPIVGSLVWDLIDGEESRLSLDDSTARALGKCGVAVDFAFNDSSRVLQLDLQTDFLYPSQGVFCRIQIGRDIGLSYLHSEHP